MKTPWWRYVLAAIAFILVVFLAPLLSYVGLYILERFTPNYYKAGEMWLWLVAYIIGTVLAANVALFIAKEKIIFVMVLALLHGVYAVVVGTMNYVAWGANAPDSVISYIISGVLVIGFVVYGFIKMRKTINGNNP